jgi:hypothetical protein
VPNLFRKISDYDRLAEELEDVKTRLVDIKKELEKTKGELRKTIGQLEHSQERVKEERKRRADEEARRGAVEKQLGSMQEEVDSLRKQLQASREIATEPERIAVLEREADLEQDGVLTFLNETDFEPGNPCITAAVPSPELETYLDGIPGMGAWISRIAKDERGLFVFISGRRACFLEPPLPVKEKSSSTGEGFDLATLDPFLEKPLVGFMSLHRDSYAFGIIDGEVRESTFEEKDVIGKSKKGGFSQARYSRSRDDQFKHLLTEAGNGASKLFLDSDVEYIFVEGDERAISALTSHEGITEGRQIIRFTVPGKMGKAISGRLPGYIWSWRAWAFSLPGHVD